MRQISIFDIKEYLTKESYFTMRVCVRSISPSRSGVKWPWHLKKNVAGSFGAKQDSNEIDLT